MGSKTLWNHFSTKSCPCYQLFGHFQNEIKIQNFHQYSIVNCCTWIYLLSVYCTNYIVKRTSCSKILRTPIFKSKRQVIKQNLIIQNKSSILKQTNIKGKNLGFTDGNTWNVKVGPDHSLSPKSLSFAYEFILSIASLCHSFTVV